MLEMRQHPNDCIRNHRSRFGDHDTTRSEHFSCNIIAKRITKLIKFGLILRFTLYHAFGPCPPSGIEIKEGTVFVEYNALDFHGPPLPFQHALANCTLVCNVRHQRKDHRLPTTLSMQERYVFDAPIDTVFAQVARGTVDDRREAEGALLEIRQIVGTPGVPGFQQQVRVNYGALDLILIETLLASDPPFHMKVVQQPDALTRHDPSERTVPFASHLIEDLDTTFLDMFGDPPVETEISFDLSAQKAATEVLISVSLETVGRIGWFRNRKWQKRVKRQTDEIAARIESSL